jgi:hypothetical protein
MPLTLLDDCLRWLNSDPLVRCAGRCVNSSQQIPEFVVGNRPLKTIQSRPVWRVGEW